MCSHFGLQVKYENLQLQLWAACEWDVFNDGLGYALKGDFSMFDAVVLKTDEYDTWLSDNALVQSIDKIDFSVTVSAKSVGTAEDRVRRDVVGGRLEGATMLAEFRKLMDEKLDEKLEAQRVQLISAQTIEFQKVMETERAIMARAHAAHTDSVAHEQAVLMLMLEWGPHDQLACQCIASHSGRGATAGQ